jgi:transcriptional regulator with XRE-family HTH domain
MAERHRKAERARLYESPVYKDLQMRLAANVRRIRTGKGWTQEEAAHRCSMPLRLYQGVEGGTANTTLVTIARLVEGLEVDAADLLALID